MVLKKEKQKNIIIPKDYSPSKTSKKGNSQNKSFSGNNKNNNNPKKKKPQREMADFDMKSAETVKQKKQIGRASCRERV